MRRMFESEKGALRQPEKKYFTVHSGEKKSTQMNFVYMDENRKTAFEKNS